MYNTLWVPCGGGFSELYFCNIFFIKFQKIITLFGGFADEDDEESGSERVESTSVTDLDFFDAGFFSVDSADSSDDAEGSDAGRFIN